MNALYLIIKQIKDEYLDFKVIKKNDSSLMKVINVILYIITFGYQKDFMENYVTTIGNTVYIPTSWNDWSIEKKIMILKHERVHMRQAAKYGKLWYSFLYLFVWFPFVFAIYRTKFEKEAYVENIKYAIKRGGERLVKSNRYKENMLSYFLTGKYGWMCPFRGKMEKWYDETVERLLKESD